MHFGQGRPPRRHRGKDTGIDNHTSNGSFECFLLKLLSDGYW